MAADLKGMDLSQLKERYGHDKSIIELTDAIDEEWLWMKGYDVSFMTQHGKPSAGTL